MTLWLLLLGMYVSVYVVVLLLDTAAGDALSARDVLILGAAGIGLAIGAVIVGGFWRMKPWARVPAIAVHAVLLVLFGYSELTGDTADGAEGFFERTASLIWLAALAAVIGWLATHRGDFHRTPHVAPYGEDAQEQP